MTYTLVWLESAVEALRRMRTSDSQAVKALAASDEGLSVNPRPESGYQLGTSNLYPLRIGDLRVVNEVDDVHAAVYVLTVGWVRR